LRSNARKWYHGIYAVHRTCRRARSTLMPQRVHLMSDAKPTVLGQQLIDKGVIDGALLDVALREAQQSGLRLGECLSLKYGVSELALYPVLAEQFNVPFVTDIRSRINYKLLNEYPRELFSENRCYPIYCDDTRIGIVMSDPLDLDIILDVERISGRLVEVSLTTWSEMERIWEYLFVHNKFFKDDIDQMCQEFESQIHEEENSQTLSQAEILRRTKSEPVVKFVNALIESAIAQGASDIHIEPAERQANIRLRLNGMLVRHATIKPWVYAPVTSRLKILADLDIAEKRLPQDGRFTYESGGTRFDLRVSTLPTQHGEKTVMRILHHDSTVLDLERLGVPPDVFKVLCELIEKPQGMILVTGPTGSGKSTALFSCLNRIRGKSVNITTIENPVEYKLDGISQVQVNEKAGLSFAVALRSILRQDPDVILVGETRDPETAQIAIQAAQTGHLVLSTLHTNDAVAAVTRLRDLGIAPFLISSSLLAVMAQRLVRKLCARCKHDVPCNEHMRGMLGKIVGDAPIPTHVYRPTGCTSCSQTGYVGRIGVFEIAVITDAIRSLIVEGAGESRLRDTLRHQGMRSIAEHGLSLVAQGITSIDELFRVVAFSVEE